MRDPRLETLARQLIRYSCAMKPGERVLIENFGVEPEAVTALIREAYAAGAEPIVVLRDMAVQRALMLGATAEKWDEEARIDADRMRAVDAYIGLRAGVNAYEQTDVPPEKQRLYMQHYSQPVHSRIRVPDTRWVVLRYPTPAMAQQAGMSTEAFEDFYFDVCTLDYAKMSRAMDALAARMEHASDVHIRGSRHGSALLHRRYARRQVRRQVQHPRRRDLYRARARQRERGAPIQHAQPLSGECV